MKAKRKSGAAGPTTPATAPEAQLQAELQTLLHRQRLILERMPIGCVMLDPSLRVTYFNAAAERIFGFSRDEVIGREPFETIISPHLREPVEQRFRQILAGDTTAHGVNENLTKDGRTILCSWMNMPLVDEKGAIDGFLSMATDVTEQRAVEAALRIKDHAIAAATVGIVIGDLEGRVTYANESYARIRGYSDPQELIGRSAQSLSSRPEEVEEMFAALRTTGSWSGERLALRKDGSTVPVLTSASLVRDANGEPLCTMGWVYDITKRKQAEAEREAALAALAETEARFRQMAEEIRDIFWLYDFSHKRLLYVSPAFETVWGRPVEWLYNNPEGWLEPIHDDDRARVLQMAVSRESAKPFDEIYRIVRPDGQIRWIHDRRFKVFNAQGELFRVAGVAEDITDRHEASEKLHEQSMQLAHVARLSTLGELVAGIAHEVNQPLYAIANFAAATTEALRSDTDLPLAKLRQWNEDISKAALRAGDIIKRIRTYVSKSPVQRSAVNLNTLIEESVELIAFEARRKRVPVELNLARPTPTIVADPISIQQVLVNLLRNAIEAQAEIPIPQRSVSVTTRIERDHFTVAVRDNGVGVTDEGMEQLFATFYTSKPEGMGMGLPISKTIVEAHQGRIWATRNEGQGMTFHFSLPIAGTAKAESLQGAE